jgi:hypothetical protein
LESGYQGPARALLEALVAPWRPADGPPEARTEELRRRLLDFGSETEDNLACARRVAMAADTSLGAGPSRGGLAATVGETGVQIGDVLNVAEGCPIPAQVAENFPGLLQEDWDAMLRLATLLFAAAATASAPAARRSPAPAEE